MEYLILFADSTYKFWLSRSTIHYLVGTLKSNTTETGFQFAELYLCRVESIALENMKAIVLVVTICLSLVVLASIHVVAGQETWYGIDGNNDAANSTYWLTDLLIPSTRNR